MKDERSKRALRVYEGPSNPSPFMGLINSMSFECWNMDRIVGVPGAVYSLTRKTENGGKVIVKRVNMNGAVDYVWTYSAGGFVVLMKSNLYGTIWFFNSNGGNVLKQIETNLKGLLVSCDEDSIHMMSAMNHETISMLTKYDYNGAILVQIGFPAGTVYNSRSHKSYDVLFGWLNDQAYHVTNTQYLYLYKDYEYVAFLPFETVLTGSGDEQIVTSTRVMDAVITNAYIFLLLTDQRFLKESLYYDKVESYIQVYDFNFTKLAETSKFLDFESGNVDFDDSWRVVPIGLRVENNKITYQYGDTYWINIVDMTVTEEGDITLSTRTTVKPSDWEDTWQGASGLTNSLGIIDGCLWRWYRHLDDDSNTIHDYSLNDMTLKNRSVLAAPGVGFSSLIAGMDQEMYDVIATNYGLIVKGLK